MTIHRYSIAGLSNGDDREALSDREDGLYTVNSRLESAKKKWSWVGRIAMWILAGWGLYSLSSTIITAAVAPQPRAATQDTPRPAQLSELKLCKCGQTVAEAESLDCLYDSLATSWLPPHCRDDATTAEFDRSGPGGRWAYYADENGTVELTMADLGRLGETGGAFWSSREWHVAHCAFYWLKARRARETGIVVEARFDTVEHVRHCSRMIRSPAPVGVYLIEVPVRMNGSIAQRPKRTRVSENLAASNGSTH
ncbi:hypothetical protein HIM_01966 [Hirsutella minnesotensis 3608]|nr:hypothetical protein HIM_01966 [Hirsutella minnesotensis 3608]